MRRVPVGPLLAVCLLSLVASMVIDVQAAEWGRSSRITYGPDTLGDTAFEDRTFVHAAPGDVVRIPLPSDLPDAFAAYRLEVRAGDGGQAFDDSGHLIASVKGADATGAPLYVTLPDGADGAYLIRHLDYALAAPTDAETRTFFDAWIRASAQGVPTHMEVTSAASVAVHRAALAADWALVPVATVSGIWWIARTARSPPDASPAAALEIGVQALRWLRWVLLTLAPVLVLGAWGILLAADAADQTIPGPGEDWAQGVRSVGMFLIVAGVAGWGHLTWRVARAGRRLRAKEAAFPQI